MLSINELAYLELGYNSREKYVTDLAEFCGIDAKLALNISNAIGSDNDFGCLPRILKALAADKERRT